MECRWLVLVNPAFGGRQDAEAAAASGGGAGRSGVAFRVQSDPRPRARNRAGPARGRGGRDAGGDERRRPGRRGRRRACGGRDAAGPDPRRARQRPRPGARDPDDPEGAVAVLAAGETRQIDVGEATASASSASPASASTPRPTGSPTRRSCCAATSSTPTRALRALLGWKPVRFTIASTMSGSASPATRSRPPTTRPSAAACSSPPTPTSPTASSTWSRSARSGKLRFLSNLPKVFKGTHVDEDDVDVFRAAESGAERQSAVRRLRRRRAPHRPAGLRCACCRAR